MQALMFIKMWNPVTPTTASNCFNLVGFREVTRNDDETQNDADIFIVEDQPTAPLCYDAMFIRNVSSVTKKV